MFESIGVGILIVVLVLANGGWAKLKELVVKMRPNLLKTEAEKMVVEESHNDEIHRLIDNWLALCNAPDVVNDEEAIKAMEVLKSKLLGSALPKK